MKHFRREFRFFVNRIKCYWDIFELKYDQYMCPHTFNGIGLTGKPAKRCKFCEITIIITEEEFYREFGEAKFAQLKRGY